MVMNNNETDEVPLRIAFVALIITAIAIAIFMLPLPTADAPTIEPADVPHFVEEAEAATIEELDVVEVQKSTSIRALVTGYNTVPEQTDSTPCIAASGDDICGRTDVVACPSVYPLGTQVAIDGKTYVCLDRTAAKFDGRFDISCDKDMVCPRQVHGWKEVHIISDF